MEPSMRIAKIVLKVILFVIYISALSCWEASAKTAAEAHSTHGHLSSSNQGENSSRSTSTRDVSTSPNSIASWDSALHQAESTIVHSQALDTELKGALLVILGYLQTHQRGSYKGMNSDDDPAGARIRRSIDGASSDDVPGTPLPTDGGEADTISSAAHEPESIAILLDKDSSDLKVDVLTSGMKQLEKRVEKLEVTSRRTSLRSCHGLKEMGIDSTGKYVIDPDGMDTGHPPIDVICDFDSKAGDVETVISHAAGNIPVHGCSSPGCFQYDVQYDAPLGQIDALVELSASCSQGITYHCFHAPLAAFGLVQNAWWVGRTGAKRFYWSGPHADNHICACGLAKSCIKHPGLRCNCDAGSPAWYADDGVLQDKVELPVLSLFFGGLKYRTQEARFSLGPLRCSGLNAEARKLDTCLALKKMGHRSPGYYVLDSREDHGGELASRVAKCNFDLGVDDPQFEEETNTTLSPSKSEDILFNVSRSTSLSAGGTWTKLTYDTYLAKSGNNTVDLTSGEFRAPVPGVYVFGFRSVVADSDHHYSWNRPFLRARLVRNGAVVGQDVRVDGSSTANMLAFASTTLLAVNDTVAMELQGSLDGTPADAEPTTVFFGRLLVRGGSATSAAVGT